MLVVLQSDIDGSVIALQFVLLGAVEYGSRLDGHVMRWLSHGAHCTAEKDGRNDGIDDGVLL